MIMQRQTQTNDRNTKSVGYFLQVGQEKYTQITYETHEQEKSSKEITLTHVYNWQPPVQW